jgi:transcriptional antiterminator RfaH
LIDDPLWFCLKAQPKREHIAASHLRHEFQLSCFSPRLRFRKITRRGTIWFVEAMFPGYLFAQFVFSQLHRGVTHSPGVQRIVRFGDHIAAMDPAVIETLRRSAEEDEIVTVDPELKVGQAVRIAEGPMEGIEALVTQVLPAKERVRVLLEFLGRSVEMEMPAPAVLSVDPVRSNLPSLSE